MPAVKMRDIPVQHNAAPVTDAQRSARYYNSGTAFQLQQSAVPPSTFVEEAGSALAPDAPTGIIYCDNSAALGLTTPATSPNILARYVVLRPGDSLTLTESASTMIFYVIRGAGQAELGEEAVVWSEGDVFIMPGGALTLSTDATKQAVLWVVGDDPLVAFMDIAAKPTATATIAPVHYPAADIKRQIDLIYSTEQEQDTAGRALIFSSEAYDASRNIAPVLTLALNTLDPGTATRVHRHNSAAIMLVLAGETCHSTVDDMVKQWSPLSTTVTPPFAWHAHHNSGAVRAELLIVQDGGIFTHSRVNGFSFG